MFTKMLQSLRGIGEQISRRVVIVPVVVAVTMLCLSIAALSINTYVVTDGAETTVHRSYETDEYRLLASIGKSVDELDEVGVSQGEDGVTNLTVQRAQEITIAADGAERMVRVRQSDTVAQALERAGITLSEQDEVSPSAEQLAMEAEKISVARVTITQTLKTVDIPFEKVTKKTASLDAGKTRIAQAGENGKKQQTYEVKTRDGVVVSETLLKETVVSAPKAQITEQGTRQAANVVGGSGTLATSRGGAPLRYKKVLDVVATAYSSELISNKWTATGAVARVGLIAVDPKVIPLGTRMYITSADGKKWIYGYAVAADTGGAIKGNKIDLFFNTERECERFGRQRAKVYILE